MAKMKIWYDEEGDVLEIGYGDKKGVMKDLGDDIWERVEEDGKITGILILGFKKRFKEKKIEIETPVRLIFAE